MSKPNFAIRDSDREKDVPFIMATWLRNYKNSSYFAKRISNSVYFNWHHKLLEALLKRESAEVIVAHPPGEPDVILGYMVTEMVGGEQVIHYVYVKQVFRNMGIAKGMLEHSGVELSGSFFSHWTYDLDSILKTKTLSITYDPYRV